MICWAHEGQKIFFYAAAISSLGLFCADLRFWCYAYFIASIPGTVEGLRLHVCTPDLDPRHQLIRQHSDTSQYNGHKQLD